MIDLNPALSQTTTTDTDTSIIHSMTKHKDMHLYSGNSWLLLIPLDYDLSCQDGIRVAKGGNYVNVNITYDADTILMFGADITHYSS